MATGRPAAGPPSAGAASDASNGSAPQSSDCGRRGRLRIFGAVRARGYTLVELIVAVTVVAVGVLAAASSAAPVGRLVRWGGAESGAAAAASATLETLRSGGCARLVSGDTIVAGRYHVSWSAAAEGALRAVRLTVVYASGTAPRADTLETAVACGP